MKKRYDILEFISQREDREMPRENENLVHVANVIRRATEGSREDEEQSSPGYGYVISDKEKREAERFSKENNQWIPIADIFSLGIPGPSGSESDTYISKEGYIYKTNNLMHSKDSIMLALQKYILYNLVFPDTAYTYVGFTGFDGRSIYPIVRQNYIKDCSPAMQNEIDCYMAAIGFEKIGKGRYENYFCTIWDVLPKNVLKDISGDIFVIDAEIELK